MSKKVVLIIVIFIVLTGCSNRTYKITFLDDGKELATALVKEGEAIKNIKNPIKEGYIFVSWLKDEKEYDINSKVSSDMTLTASWTQVPDELKNHTITFNFGSYTKTQTVKDGEPVVKPKDDPKKEKHRFLGWYVGDDLYDFSLPVTKDIIIAAKFEKDRIVVNYDLNGGVGTVQVEIDRGTIPEKPKNPTRFGYDFIGWLLDGKPYNFDFPLNDDTTIKANWEATNYVTINFDSAGGNDIKSEVIVSGNKLPSLPTPIKEGHTFKYWTLSGEKFDASTPIESNITLVAVYEENES